MLRQCFFQYGKTYVSKPLHFSLLTLNESFKIEAMSTAVQKDEIAKPLLFQGQSDMFFISQRKPYKVISVWLICYSWLFL